MPEEHHRHARPDFAKVVLGILLVVGALAAAGCGSSNSSKTSTDQSGTVGPSVNMSTVESGIKQEFSTSGATVTAVKCPSNVKSKAGTTFECNVTWSNDATGKVKVTETRLNHFSYSLVSGSVQIPGSSVDTVLEQDLAKQGAPNATVNCPQNIIVKVGTTVTCDVSGGGGTVGGTVTFTFSSAEGTIEPSSVKSG